MPRRAFPAPFGHDTPTPDDVAQLGTRLDIVRGTQKGLVQKAQEQVRQSLAGPMLVADGLAEKMAEAINDPIGDAGLLRQAMEIKAHQAIVASMLPAAEVAIGLGYQPAGYMGGGSGGKGKRRKKKAAAPVSDDPRLAEHDPPISQPPDLSQLSPDYLVVANCRLGQSAAIPGLFTTDLAAAGWVPLGTVAQLRAIPPAQVPAYWSQLMRSIGCPVEVPAAATIPPTVPPGGALPPGALPGFRPPGFRVAGAGEEVPAEAVPPPITTGVVSSAGLTSPIPAAPPGTLPGGVPPRPSYSDFCLDFWDRGHFTDSHLAPDGWVSVYVGSVEDINSGNIDKMGNWWMWPVTGCGAPAQAVPPLPGPVQPVAGAVPPLVPPVPGAVPPLVPPVPGAVPPLMPPAPALPGMPFPVAPVPPGSIPLPGPGFGPVPPFGTPGGGVPPWLNPFPLYPLSFPSSPITPAPRAQGCVRCGCPLPPSSIQPSTVPLPVQPAQPAAQCPPCPPATPCPPAPVQPAAPAPAPCPPPVVHVTCPQCGQENPVVGPSPLPIEAPPGAEPTAFGFPLPGAIAGALPAAAPSAEPPAPTGKSVTASPEQLGSIEGWMRRVERLAVCLPQAEFAGPALTATARVLLDATGGVTGGDNPSYIPLNELYNWLVKKDTWWSKALLPIVDFLGPFIVTSANALDGLNEALGKLAGCPGGSPLGIEIFRWLLGILEKYVGALPDTYRVAVDQLVHAACPNELPSALEASAAWLRGGLTDEEWECLTIADGKSPLMARKVRDSERHTVSLEDVYLLRRRGFLTDEEYAALIRRHGVTDGRDAQLLHRAQDWTPTPAEAIEWMLKDLGDPVLTQTFGLGQEFSLKYQGDVKAALEMNAVSEPYARNLLKAHWRTIAPHQLYEMHKRLRPGFERLLSDEEAKRFALTLAPRRPKGPGAQAEIDATKAFLEEQAKIGNLYGGVTSPEALGYPPLPPVWADEIVDGRTAKAFLAEVTTTPFHVYESLSQSAYPPFWRARLAAISYNVLTRVDIRRAYETSQIDLPQLVELLQDRGYTSVNAERLGGFFKEAATQLATRRPAANQWVQTGYDETLLMNQLLDQGMRQEMWPSVIQRLRTRRTAYVQQTCMKHLKKQYLVGLVQDEAVYARLVAVGLPGNQAHDVQQQWLCEKQARPKHEGASQVCKMLHQDLVSPPLARDLVTRLGYTRVQASRIVASCLLTKPPKSVMKKPAGKDFLQIAEEGL